MLSVQPNIVFFDWQQVSWHNQADQLAGGVYDKHIVITVTVSGIYFYF